MSTPPARPDSLSIDRPSPWLAITGRALLAIVPPLILFALVVLVWELAIRWWNVKPYLFPGPGFVFRIIVQDARVLASAMAYTGAAALVGFAASLLAGTLVAIAFSQSQILRASGYPYAIFLQTVPIVAIAPLIIRWCGYGFSSIALIAFIISVFPIITNATAGLLNVDSDLVDLFRLNNASRWQVLWKLRLPSAIPSICIGAKTSSGLAVVGAIIGEFFAGYDSRVFGLGFLIQTTTDKLQTDKLFATVIISTLLGVLIFGAISLATHLILTRWYDAPAEHRR